jgi:hypothetical protein
MFIQITITEAVNGFRIDISDGRTFIRENTTLLNEAIDKAHRELEDMKKHIDHIYKHE